jgi:hypothetical protein
MADNWTDQISVLLDEALRAEAASYEAAEFKRMADTAKKTADAAKDAARKSLAALLTDAGVITENHPRATITLASGRPQVIEAEDADVAMLPDQLVRIKREPDKGKILAALAKGQSVPGYSIGVSDPTLTIKLKEPHNV